MTTAAVYIRVSTEDQTEFSPEAQLRALKQYAEKNDIIIEEEYIFRDEGISGRKADKRPAFQKMIATAKTKPRPFDVILVHKFDRFARSREDSVVYKSLLKKEAGIKVVSITESIEDDKFSVILEAMLEAMAEYYSLNLAEEVKKGMTEKAYRGELQTPAPFGYRMTEGILTPQEEEAMAVQQIFHKYVSENENMRTIAKYINSLGFRTKRGNAFDIRRIEYIICNPIYIGKMRWTPTGSVVCNHDFDNPDTIIMDGKHKAIVEKEIWEQANILIRARKRQRIPRYNVASEITTHWLRGVLRCASCGTTLSFGRGSAGKQSAYRCNKYLTGSCTESQRVTISKVEKIVMDTLIHDANHFSQDEFNRIRTESDMHTVEMETYRKQLIKLEHQLKKAKELVLNGIDTPEEYRENKERIMAQMDDVKMRIAELASKMEYEKVEVFQEKIKSIADILTSDASLSKKNEAIKEIVSKIVYDKKMNTFHFYYYYISRA